MPERIIVTGQWVDAAPTKAQVLAGTPACLAVARIDPVKNHALMLEACAVLAAGSDVRWHMVGGCDDPSYLTRLQAMARRLGVADRVLWHGYRPDARRFMLGSAVTVLASHHEGVPRAVQEAMTLGVPTVMPKALATDLAHAGLPVTYSGGAEELARAIEYATNIGGDVLAAAAARTGRVWSRERVLQDWNRAACMEEDAGAVV
ncbi:glycosyltransferase [Streptomyces sp. NPDC059837]|uniref:glycosyltransferase n=1 Tax=unclassified Streptomyces TaxID=2593676 RepID=UPI003649980F